MPTFQSTPAMPWIFPDEAYHMNRKGMQPLKPAPVRSLDLLPPAESEAHALFADHERRMVHERLRVNKKKESGMLGHGEMNARSQRYVRPASRSAVPNGVFHGSPMEYTTSAGLRGGVITTKEGQEWLAKRLKERAQEYEAISTGNFSAGPPRPIEVTPYGEIDSLLQVAFTAITTGSFSSSLNDSITRLLQSLIKVGATISPSQLTKYAQAIGNMIVTARSYSAANFKMAAPEMGGELDTKKYYKLETIQESLKVLDAAVREIARVIYEPLSAREQVMRQLQSRLTSSQLAAFNPAERVGITERPAPMELGQPRQAAPLFPPPEPVEEVGDQPGAPYPDLPVFDAAVGLGRRRGRKYF